MNFSDSDRSLFSPEDIRRLMRIEYERAVRYGIPICLMLIEVDRLGYLQDLYGYESKEEILGGVIGLMRTVTRDCDVVGCLHDDRLMAVFPHTTEAGARAVTGRLLEGARGLGFRSDGRSLRITLSIGYTRAGEEGAPQVPFDLFHQATEEAVEEAVESGGDRVVEGVPEELEAELPPVGPGEPPAAGVAPVSAAAGGAEAPLALPDLDDLPDASLAEQIRVLFRALGPRTAGLAELERRVIDTAESGLQSVIEGSRHSQAEQEQQIDVLERRVSKLREMLESTEEELNGLMRQKSVDPGIQSIYRTVQGLSSEAGDYEKKKDILGLIYEANVRLLEKLKSGS